MKDPDFEPNPKKQRKEKDKLEEKQYCPGKQVPNNTKLHTVQVGNAYVGIIK